MILKLTGDLTGHERLYATERGKNPVKLDIELSGIGLIGKGVLTLPVNGDLLNKMKIHAKFSVQIEMEEDTPRIGDK